MFRPTEAVCLPAGRPVLTPWARLVWCLIAHETTDIVGTVVVSEDAQPQTPRVIVIGGRTGREKERFSDEVVDGWQLATPVNVRQSGFAAATLRHCVYVAGGENNRSVECYDGTTWRFVAPLVLPRRAFGLVSSHDHLYAVGGSHSRGSPSLNHTDRYWPETNQWLGCRSMPTPRDFLEVVALRDGIYALGGREHPSYCHYCSSVVHYRPDLDEWYQAAPMRFERVGFSSAVCRDRVFALGTASLTTLSIEAFDPREPSWQVVGELHKATAGARCVEWRGDLVLLGGSQYGLASSSSSVLIFDVRTLKWRDWPGLTVSRLGHAAVFLDQ